MKEVLEQLTLAHVEMCLQSLSWTRRKFTEYQYQSEDIRAGRLREVDETVIALRRIKQLLKENR
jgi:hypothetical protein